MRDGNCIFCKIANGEIPSKTIYEDDEFRVILDLSPATKGHALIIPKDHYSNLFDLPDSIAGKVLKIAKKIAILLTEKLQCSGINIVQNNGEVAGQTVFHFHMHLIPRYIDDNQQIGWKDIKISQEELEDIKNRILENKEV